MRNAILTSTSFVLHTIAVHNVIICVGKLRNMKIEGRVVGILLSNIMCQMKIKDFDLFEN